MYDERQAGLLDLFSHVGKPVPPQSVLHGELELRSKSYDGAGGPKTAKPEGDAEIIGRAPRGKFCSLFDPQVMEEAMTLSRLFTKQASYSDFVEASLEYRPIVNEELLVFAMTYAVLNRKDTRTLQVPPVEEVIPYWYFPASVIAEAQRRASQHPTSKEEIVLSYKWSVSEDEPESKLSYFREDIGANSHHWHWHQAYPFDHEEDEKDRKGELFYYMHHQLLARYDAERMCNGLSRTTTLSDFRYDTLLEEGYYPDLNTTISGSVYASRPRNTVATDIASATIEDMIRWKTHITDAIDEGFVVKKSGERLRLEDPRGIDVLGDIIESASISVDQEFYGNYHNSGHMIIARAHNPDGNFGENEDPQGVMANTSTAMRDPIFYRWHREIDNIFNKYKMTLQPYTRHQLELCGIRVYDVSVTGELSKRCNYLQTFLEERKVLLSRGLDFGLDREVSVSITHLQHEEFVYNIDIDNQSRCRRQVVVRIFLAPMADEGHELLTFDEQRMLFIELEKYQTTVQPGRQVLKRSSKHSNVTIAPARGFALLGDKSQWEVGSEKVQSFCGCGWPDHLLIPRGTAEGTSFVLLVMITDWDRDKVESLPEKTCGDAASYCGIRDQKYPDRRTMGFPFDRRFEDGETLESFAGMSNVATAEITVRHSGDGVTAEVDSDTVVVYDECERCGCHFYGRHQYGCPLYDCGQAGGQHYGRRHNDCHNYYSCN